MPDAEIARAMRVACTIFCSESAACRVMKIARPMATSASPVATWEPRRDHGIRMADQAADVPSRASEAARPASAK